MPDPSWVTSLLNSAGRKRSDKITHVQKLLHLKTTAKNSAQPAKGQQNSSEVLCFLPFAERLDLSGVRLNLVHY